MNMFYIRTLVDLAGVLILTVQHEQLREAALHSDGLSDTINYAEVYETVKSEMAIPSDLLEHVAGRIIRALQARFPKITGGKIAVTKKRPPIAAEIDEVSAIVEW